jgi:hypothetical protein
MVGKVLRKQNKEETTEDLTEGDEGFSETVLLKENQVRMRNIDVSSIVSGHMTYRTYLCDVLTYADINF